MNTQELIDNSAFLQIERSDQKTLYVFGIIIIILLAIFQRLSVGLNIIFGLLLGTIFVLYLNTRNQFANKEIKEIYDKKTNLLRPKPKKIQEYEDFVDFFFSIQDLHPYNVPAYEDLIDSTDDFLLIYEESKLSPELAGFNYNLADGKRKDAVSSLHSIIYNLPNSFELMNKLNNATETLNTMMYKKLDEIYSLNKLHIFNKGYNNSTVELLRGPKPENFYDDEPYTFDIF